MKVSMVVLNSINFRKKMFFMLLNQSLVEEKELGLKPKDAAELIGCSECKIKELVREKKIPHYRLGVRILFTRSALEKWIANQEKRSCY